MKTILERIFDYKEIDRENLLPLLKSFSEKNPKSKKLLLTIDLLYKKAFG
jgi:hypothetical protein